MSCGPVARVRSSHSTVATGGAEAASRPEGLGAKVGKRQGDGLNLLVGTARPGRRRRALAAEQRLSKAAAHDAGVREKRRDSELRPKRKWATRWCS